MKILFLTVIPSPYQREFLSAIAKESNLDVHVRYYALTERDRQWKKPSLETFESIFPGRSLYLFGSKIHFNSKVISEIKRIGPDLVIVSDYSAPSAQIAMRWMARHGVPFVFWGETPGYSDLGGIGRSIRKWFQGPLRNAAAIAGIGSVAVKTYEAMFPGQKVYNIPYHCDLSAYVSGTRSKNDLEKSTVDILFSGQLIHRKGVDVLIKAFAKAVTFDSRLRLKILGDGRKREPLQNLVPSSIRSKVEFLGFREPSALPRIFANSDIFCLPSRHDGWGVVVNEALGAGLPLVLSSEVGARKDLVEQGVNGFIFPTENDQELADRILDLSDDHLRRTMSDESAKLASAWSLASGVRRWVDLLEEVLPG